MSSFYSRFHQQSETISKDIRILIAEHDPMVRRIYSSAFEKLELNNVHFASSGKQAVDMLKHQKSFDLMITEWSMPGLDGMEMMEYIRMHAPDRVMFMPVLFVSGMSMRRHIEAARDFGVNGFIAKPFNIEELYTRMRAVLLQPRDFVMCDVYRGPCRRRQRKQLERTNERRRVLA